MKTLDSLLTDLCSDLPSRADAIQIDNITNDSRLVTKNTLFLAYPGAQSDGRKYIAQAIEKGAAAICYEPTWAVSNQAVPLIPIANLAIQQSKIAALFYDFPSTKIPVIGVTGTNGKTSITHFIAQALNPPGIAKAIPTPFSKGGEQSDPLSFFQRGDRGDLPQHCGIIGTIGYGFLNNLTKTLNTTPDGLQLQKIIAELISHGAGAIAMEVSSHALAQQRVNDIQFHTAVFTNLTQDHLDYHHTMENYRAAKELLLQQSGLKNAVINIDDAAGQYYAEKYRDKLNVITYAVHDKTAHISVEKCTPTEHGFDLTVKTPWGRGEFHLPLIGEFNIHNALAVFGVLGILSLDFEMILRAMSQLQTVNGRMQLLKSPRSPFVIVDYAHTPDALEKALQSIRTHCNGKLICVFGCGGDRDKTKRPLMGAIADRLADEIIITNDNPRTESPEAIADDILTGVVNRQHCTVTLDRAVAIHKAIESASKQDWILIAGKGHETEQIIGNQTLHHNDVACVMNYINKERNA